MIEDEGSLERFLSLRGQQLLGQSYPRAAQRIQIAIGSGLVALGLGIGLVAYSSGGSFLPAGLGPLLAGAVNLGVGAAMKLRWNSPATEVKLTPEAKAFLLQLFRRYHSWGWPAWGMTPGEWNGWAGRHQGRALQPPAWTGFAAPPVDDVTLGLVRRATFEYNRIAGTLAMTAGSHAALAKLAPRLTAAADEAIADVLHQAAMMSRYQESGNVARAQLESRIESLREMAERIEAIAAKEPSLTEKVGYRNKMDDALEELRLEQLARMELRNDAERNRLEGSA